MTKVVGLDISKRCTGVAIGDATGPPALSTFASEGDTLGDVGVCFQKRLSDICRMERPDVLVYEAALLHTDAQARASTARLLLGLAFMAEAVGRFWGARVEAVHQQSWRSQIIGAGRPKNPKRVAIDFMAGLGWPVGNSSDKADAAGVWAYGHLHYGRRAAIRHLLSQATVDQLAPGAKRPARAGRERQGQNP